VTAKRTFPVQQEPAERSTVGLIDGPAGTWLVVGDTLPGVPVVRSIKEMAKAMGWALPRAEAFAKEHGLFAPVTIYLGPRPDVPPEHRPYSFGALYAPERGKA
jgi:hypothetical protein